MTTVRRVRRIVRKVDAWTVFKVSALMWSVGGIAVLLGLVMFWAVVAAAGIPDAIGGFLVDITLLEEGANPFADGGLFFRIALLGVLAGVVVATALTTLAAVLYNLVTDIVGGVEIVVLEETYAPSVGVVPVLPPLSVDVDEETEEIPVSRRR